MNCELCDPKRETEWIDNLPAGFDFNVFRCRTDGLWMIVAKHHGDWLPGEKGKAEKLRDLLFPGRPIRWEMKQLPGHAHCHVGNKL